MIQESDNDPGRSIGGWHIHSDHRASSAAVRSAERSGHHTVDRHPVRFSRSRDPQRCRLRSIASPRTAVPRHRLSPGSPVSRARSRHRRQPRWLQRARHGPVARDSHLHRRCRRQHQSTLVIGHQPRERGHLAQIVAVGVVAQQELCHRLGAVVDRMTPCSDPLLTRLTSNSGRQSIQLLDREMSGIVPPLANAVRRRSCHGKATSALPIERLLVSGWHEPS